MRIQRPVDILKHIGKIHLHLCNIVRIIAIVSIWSPEMKYLFGLNILAIAVVMGCGGRETSSTDQAAIFRYNESSGISSLDPAFARNIENISAIHQIFDGLVCMDKDLNVKPAIATFWNISDDGKEYTFVLRSDVYFHDHQGFENGTGRQVVASDFVNSFLRISDPKLASPGAWIFQHVDKRDDHLGFEAVSDDTLKIYLKESFPPFLGLLTMKYCSVVPFEIVELLGRDFRSEPVGTGPFVFKYWQEGEKLVLLKNQRYWDKDLQGNKLPYLDAINISFIRDEDAEYLEFVKGNLDYLSGTMGSYFEFLDGQGNLKEKYKGQFVMTSQPYLNTEYLGFLVDPKTRPENTEVLMDKRVRAAIHLGFDRKSMIKYLRNNIGTPALNGFIPFGLPSFDDEIKYNYNPDSAAKLLAMAGYPNGENLPEIVLSTTSQYITLCEYIASQLSELGIKIKLEVNPAATNREMVALSRVAFFRKSWVADYPDAENYLSLFYSDNFSPEGPNYTHFTSREYDKLYEQSMQEVDAEKRIDLYRKMNDILIEEVPVVPLYYDQVIRFVSNEIRGLESNALNLLDLRFVNKVAPTENSEN